VLTDLFHGLTSRTSPSRSDSPIRCRREGTVRKPQSDETARGHRDRPSNPSANARGSCVRSFDVRFGSPSARRERRAAMTASLPTKRDTPGAMSRSVQPVGVAPERTRPSDALGRSRRLRFPCSRVSDANCSPAKMRHRSLFLLALRRDPERHAGRQIARR